MRGGRTWRFDCMYEIRTGCLPFTQTTRVEIVCINIMMAKMVINIYLVCSFVSPAVYKCL